MSSEIESSTLSAPETVRSNPFQRLIGVLFSPVETMKSIVAKPDWLVPMIVLIVLSFVASMLIFPHINAEKEVRANMERAAEKHPMPPDMMEKQVEVGIKVTNFIFKWGWLTTPVWMLITALILFAAFKVFGGAMNFAQAFSITLYGWMPNALQSLLVGVVLAMKSGQVTPTEFQTSLRSNLGFLFDVKAHPALFQLGMSIDAFTLWVLFLLIVGFSLANRFSRGKSAVLIVSMWVIFILLRVLPAALFA